MMNRVIVFIRKTTVDIREKKRLFMTLHRLVEKARYSGNKSRTAFLLPLKYSGKRIFKFTLWNIGNTETDVVTLHNSNR